MVCLGIIIIIFQSIGTSTSLLCFRRRRKINDLGRVKSEPLFSLVENVLIVLLSSVAQLKMSTVSAQDPASLLFLTCSSSKRDANSYG